MRPERVTLGAVLARAPVRFLLVLSLILCAGPTLVHAAGFSASLDRDTALVGDNLTLSIVFEDLSPSEAPQPPRVAGLTMAYAGQSSQSSWINGRRSASITYSYVVRAAQPGDYTLPAITGKAGGRTYQTQPLKLRVVAAAQLTPDAATAGKNAFLRLVASTNRVYPGQVLPVEIRLYALQGKLKQGPELKADGFTSGRILQGAQSKALVGNQYYNVLAFKSYVAAAKTGTLQLSASMPLLVLPPNPRYSLFGDPLDWTEVGLQSDPLPVQVVPLPTNGVPPDFNGAVGTFSLAVSLSTNTVSAGDPITLTVRLTGRGLIDALSPTDLGQWPGFKTYSPVTRVETTDELGIVGTKTFEQVIIPESSDIKAVPPIHFSFFDPDLGTYQTLQHPAQALVIHPASAPNAQPLIAAPAVTGQSSSPARPATDIVHIKNQLGLLVAPRAPLLQRPAFFFFLLLPIAAWLAAALWRRHTDAYAANPRRRRRDEVRRFIASGLVQLGVLASRQQAAEFFALAFRLLQETLGERLDLPAAAITESVIEERLRSRDLDAAFLGRLQQLFQACNQARYAPTGSATELAALIPEIEAILAWLQEIPTDVPR